MPSSILAKQLEEGLSDYIKTTFPMATPGFKDSIPNLIAAKDSVFHEPYVGGRESVSNRAMVDGKIVTDREKDYETAWKFFEGKYSGSAGPGRILQNE
jgi:hypothetical protein